MKTRKRRSRGLQSPVSLGGVSCETGLPMPCVAYPGHYGTFFLFGENPEGPWHFCQCARTALSNLVELTRRRADREPDRRRGKLLGSRHVPEVIATLVEANDNDPLTEAFVQAEVVRVETEEGLD